MFKFGLESTKRRRTLCLSPSRKMFFYGLPLSNSRNINNISQNNSQLSSMSKVPKKPFDQSLNFDGFLNGLQGWDKNSNSQVSHKGKAKVEFVTEEKQPLRNSTSNITSNNNSTSQYRPSMKYDPLSQMSSGFLTKDKAVDAASEKDLGNEYYKQKKFNEAIDCYSRSIAFSPTAVAYGNRAMAYLKIRRFQEAEDDCTEALNLDDRYIKAYSRRATARKELGKLRDSLEDVEFALRLDSQDKELKKQRADVKSLLEKAILAKAAGTTKRPPQGVKEVEIKVDAQDKAKRAPSLAVESKKPGVDVLPGNKQVSIEELNVSGDTLTKNKTKLLNGGDKVAPNMSHVKCDKASNELHTSINDLASRAASRATAEAAKNIIPPNSAYQFEVSWRGFCGDRSLQSRLLKVTPPDALPEIFKNALTAPLLVDIVKCLATLFTEEIELVVKYLENLTKVPRFGMIIMCLPSSDKADLQRIWNEVFLSKAAPIESAESLSDLRPRYCP